MDKISNRRNLVDRVVGLAIIGALLVGLIGLIAALIQLFNGELLAAGLFLLAAALAVYDLSDVLLTKTHIIIPRTGSRQRKGIQLLCRVCVLCAE